MKPSKGKGLAAGPRGTGRQRSTDRQLVLLDQEPLRRETASKCAQEMARLEKAKAEWKRYEVEDQTAYARWSATTFGPLLSRLREIEAALHEKEALIQDVQMEIFYGGSRNPRTAYARVQKRRDNPPPEFAPQTDGWEGSGPPPDGGEDEVSLNEDELEEVLLFEEYLSTVLGLDPDRMSDQKYRRLFDEFKTNVLRPARSKESRSAPEAHRPPESARPEQNRVKELYRLLVRRLHPDTRADSDAGVSALWHEVQDAYSQGNVERLEMLLALTDLRANEVGERTTLSQMRAVLKELRRSFNALQKNLKEAKTGPAWNFSRTNDHSGLERRMRFEIQATLQWKHSELCRLESMIASWAPVSKKRGGKKEAARKQAGRAF